MKFPTFPYLKKYDAFLPDFHDFPEHIQHQNITSNNVNTLRPRQNDLYFADDIFKCISLNEKVWILIKISLNFVPKGPINNMPALVQIMAWRLFGTKPLSKSMLGNCQLDSLEQTSVKF